MSCPFEPERGKVFVHRPVGSPERWIRFVEHLGSWVLRFSPLDDDAGVYMVPLVGAPDTLVMTTVEWAFMEIGAGRLLDPHLDGEPDDRGKRFLGWDRAACFARDQKSVWKHDWGRLAVLAGRSRSGPALAEWLMTAPGPEPKPAPRSLIRYMNTYLKAGRPSMDVVDLFVNKAGRLPGQSQLTDVVDRLVHHWSTRFWAGPTIASMDDAAANVVVDWHELKARGVAGLGSRAPTGQAVVDRIKSLRCRETVAARYGEHEARRLFGAVGEPVPVEACFELVMIDGAQFRHAVLIAPDWRVEAPQMKAVIAMDAKSQFVWDPPVFFGPFRPEMAMRAVRNVMVCDMSEQELAADPMRAGLHQPPLNLYYDNDKALLPPGAVPNIANIVSSIATGTPYSPDEKSKLENFIKYLKHNLSRMPGQILGPRRRADPRRDPIAEASVDRLQYAAAVRNLVQRWNTHPKTSLGNRSPEQIIRAELG